LCGVFAVVFEGDAKNCSRIVTGIVELVVSDSIQELLERSSSDGELPDDLFGRLGTERLNSAAVRSVDTFDWEVQQLDALAEEILTDCLDFAPLPKQAVGEDIVRRPVAGLHWFTRLVLGKTVHGVE
jgi:hypothetical protein